MTPGQGKTLGCLLWIAILLALGVCLYPYHGRWDDGMRELPFHFEVREAGTGRPLAGVRIILYEVTGKQSQEIRTGANGTARVELPCMTFCKTMSGLVLSYSRRSVSYAERLVVVQRPGYRSPEPVFLTALVGQHHLGDYAPPRAVTFDLEPE